MANGKYSFHVSAFSESQAAPNTLPLVNFAAVLDEQLQTSGDDLIFAGDGVEQLLGVWGLWAGSANAQRAQLFAPSFRDVYGLEVIEAIPVDTDATPGTTLPPLNTWDPAYAVRKGERLNLRAANNNTAERLNAVAFLGKSKPAKAPGMWRTIHAVTTASALTANVWGSRALTLDMNLVPGTYELGGALVRSTSLDAFRFIMTGQWERPGGLGHAAASLVALGGQRDHIDNEGARVFRAGNSGVWGRFTQDAPPTVQLLANAADNEAQDVWLDIRKVA